MFLYSQATGKQQTKALLANFASSILIRMWMLSSIQVVMAVLIDGFLVIRCLVFHSDDLFRDWIFV